jgi:hypothetical protein
MGLMGLMGPMWLMGPTSPIILISPINPISPIHISSGYFPQEAGFSEDLSYLLT